MTRWSRCVYVSTTLLVLSLPASTQSRRSLKVDETRSRLRIDASGAEVGLWAPRTDRAPLTVTARVELIDGHGAALAKGSVAMTLVEGGNTVRVPLETVDGRVLTNRVDELKRQRLEYRVEPDDTRMTLAATGVIPAVNIADVAFELVATHASFGLAGTALPVSVLAFKDDIGSPVRDVVLEAELATGDADNIVRASGVSGRDGMVRLELPLEALDQEYRRGSLTITGRKNEFDVSLEREVEIFSDMTVLTTMDKLLYRPGEVFHARFLLRDSGKRSLDATKLKLEIRDPEYQRVVRRELTTSRFGIARFDWPIPDSARLGDYRITITPDVADRGWRHQSFFKVSRYDLPAFEVSVAKSAPFYLAGEDAEVHVRADYLFGEPVTSGLVRVGDEEETLGEGELSEDGTVTIPIDLSDAHEDLAESRYRHHRDLELAAYVTDASTGRTEPRKFTVRISKEPIHVYLIETWNRSGSSPLYVSTFRADGEPVACDVTVESVSGGVPWHRHVRTNRYGVAELSGLGGALADGPELVVTARADDGLEGHTREDLYRDHDHGSAVEVRLGKTIYRPGQDIVAEIRGPRALERVAVALSRSWDVLDVQIVRLSRGKGRAVFRYDERFRGVLGVEALDLSSSSDFDADVLGSHPAFYPYERELHIDVTPDRATHRPGSSARLDFAVARPDGSSVEAALGVAIIDRALEERMRTVLDFGSGWRSWRYRQNDNLFNYETLGSVSERDLRRLEPDEPVSAELDLVAKIMFRNTGAYSYVSRTSPSERSVANHYRTLITEELRAVSATIDERFSGRHYPSTAASLRAELRDAGVALERFLDPWGRAFRPEVQFVGSEVRVSVVSAGVDGKERTGDDWVGIERSWSYFAETGESLTGALADYERRHMNKVVDETSLRDAATAAGVDLETLRDPWGRRLRFTMEPKRNVFSIGCWSAGPDGRFASGAEADDIRLWEHRYSIFPVAQRRIRNLLMTQPQFPTNDGAFIAVLASADIAWAELRDIWGTPFTLQLGQNPRGEDYEHTLSVRSAGPDRTWRSDDDLTVASFDRTVRAPISERVDVAGAGTVRGRVTDSAGAVLPGTSVVLENDAGTTHRTTTNRAGEYVLIGIPPGVYTLRVELPGFVSFQREGLEVGPSVVLVQNASLDVGTVSEAVTVTAESPTIETANASIASAIDNVDVIPDGDLARPIATPRVREHFPETLVWEPELVTGEDGKASLSFDFADNITTWKVSVIASTEEGDVGRVTDELMSFQPFFIDYEPPKVLTEGDVISQPVVLRNYEDTSLDVELTFEPEPSLELRGRRARRAEVFAKSFADEIFVVHARLADPDARATVTARSHLASDAIAKATVILPDGREVVSTRSGLLRGEISLPLPFPAHAVRGTRAAELTVLPNLVSHVVASVDDIMRRPYGCAEQTTSSGYPSLLLSRYVERTGSTRHVNPELLARAERYVELAYERLTGYQERAGGFSYWGNGQSDIALTAYVLRFLSEARDVIDVDERVLGRGVRWLVGQQRGDGSWRFSGSYGARSDEHALALTATTAHTLANADRGAAARALAYLEKRLDTMAESYAVAATALAALEMNDADLSRDALARLRGLATTRDGKTFWPLHGFTPYRGWGRAGDIETTALAVRALATGREKKLDVPDQLIGDGISFLLSNKDRYGVWFTTQATVKSAEALLSTLGAASTIEHDDSVEVLVDGELVRRVELSGLSPTTLKLGDDLVSGAVTLRRTAKSSQASDAMAELVTRHYEPWTSTARTVSDENLRLSVRFNETETSPGSEIECTVEIARNGDSGWGTLLAEIGLPPAVDVDRASLEKASGYQTGLYRYDVLPDRLIAYVWPRNGVSTFTFKFRARLAMHAKSAPSQVYDYYNPDASVTLPPETFVVRD